MDPVISTSLSTAGTADPPVTSEEFLERSSSWTLACDNALLNRLKTFSENLSRQSRGILEDCDSLSTDLDLLNSRVQTVTNEFLMLSNTQFTENRVEEFQEMLSSTPTSQNVPVKTKAEKEADLIAKMKEAIKIGVSVKSGHVENRDNVNEPATIKLNLPHIIGTPKFFSSRYCGLLDEMKLQPITSHDAEELYSEPNSPDVDFPTDDTQAKSYSSPIAEAVPTVSGKTDSFQDIFFPSRELYVPPSTSNQSFYKDGSSSPASDDQFIHGGTPSTATSSNSNLAHDNEKREGSNTSSFSERKPNSVMDELENKFRREVPPPIIDDNSDDSDDFKPLPAGKGLGNSIFADAEDDDDVFGEDYLFRSKQTGSHQNEDLFFKTPNLNSLFGQNTRPTPLLLPSAPPPLSNTPQQNHSVSVTPPTLDFADSDSMARRILDKSLPIPSAVMDKVSEPLNKHFRDEASLPSSSKEEEKKPLFGQQDQNESLSQEERAKMVEGTNVEVEGSSSLLGIVNSQKINTEADSNISTAPKKVFQPKVGESFVKSMALGLKIDPTALNPGAKFPVNTQRSLSQDSTNDSRPHTQPNTSKSILIDQNVSDSAANSTEVPPQQVTVQIPKPQKSFVKTIASELKIDPHALMPGSKAPTFHSDSVAKDSDLDSTVRTSRPSIAEGDKSTPENPPKEKDFGNSGQIIPQAIAPTSKPVDMGQGQASRTNLQPGKISNSGSYDKVNPSSVFDGESSDDDLFKPKPLSVNQSQSKEGSSLFSKESLARASIPASSSYAQIKNIPSTSIVKSTSDSSGLHQRQQATKSRIQKSIFDDSDSDDELFGSKSINSRKVPILFANDKKDDDIFAKSYPSNPNPVPLNPPPLNPGLNEPKTADVVPPASNVSGNSRIGVDSTTVNPSFESVPSNRAESPLFSNPSYEDDIQPEMPPPSTTTVVTESVNVNITKFKNVSASTKNTSKSFVKKSIFGDSESDDDSLFKSSKSKKPDKENTDSTISVSATPQAVTKREKVLTYGENQEQGVDKKIFEYEAKASESAGEKMEGSVINVDSGLKAKADLLGPKLSEPGQRSSNAEFIFSAPSDLASASANLVESNDRIETEKEISFDDVVSSSTLLPNVVKDRAKVKGRNRRLPTRRSNIPSGVAVDPEHANNEPVLVTPGVTTSEEEGQDDTEIFKGQLDVDESE